jgi:CheY-like chemotaxis protein
MGRRILTDAGYEVVTVNNGSAALKKIAEHKPDLIILDIYMPGYGGLEVCQRLKENTDTARVPVLLTVGKLEPFKPDDARRVRAEAFIVKPFEASELLTALTKLEDRIVPQASKQPAKQGRFAKVLASLDAPAAGTESFGDAETGWKDRIKLPTPGTKKEEPEPETLQPVAAAAPRADLGREEDFKPQDTKKEFERPMPAGLPADITSEEIAAIAAAASAMGSKTSEAAEKVAEAVKVEPVEAKPAEPAPVAAESTPSETLKTEAEKEVATANAPSEAAPAAENGLQAETSHAATEAIAVQSVEPAAVQPAENTEQPSSAASADTSVAEAQSVSVPEKPLDAEVDAALASLAPSIDATSSASVEVPALATVAAGDTAETPRASGPRWIAEPVPLPNDESLMVLEQEMEKAYAAMVAAEAAVAELAPAPAEVSATPAPVVAEAPAIEQPGEQATPATATISETPAPQAHAEPASIENPPADAVATAEVPPETQAAYAVAAAGGSSASETPAEVSRVAAPEEETSEQNDKLREAELAAAWKHWNQIRETIVGDQFTTQLAEAAQAEIKSSATEEAAEAEEESAESGQESGVAIASIVDSVLAELKPKLVEEIAKKLESDKKKKKKK